MANKNVFLHFESVSAQRADAFAPYSFSNNQERAKRHLERNDGPQWHGMYGGAPAVLATIENGYPEGERKIAEFHESIAASLPRALGHHRTRVRGAFGDELDVHSLNRGAFDRAWSSSARKIKQGSGILRLCIDIGGSASVKAEALQWRGIAGMSLCEVMSRAGYSVEIIACFATSNSDKSKSMNAVVSTVVKPRSSKANMGLLAATVTLPGYFRSLGFCSIIRCCDKEKKFAAGGLGQTIEASGVLPVPEKITQLFVPSSVMNKDSATDWVKQSVALLQGSVAAERRK